VNTELIATGNMRTLKAIYTKCWWSTDHGAKCLRIRVS